jgi:hypothetical protein
MPKAMLEWTLSTCHVPAGSAPTLIVLIVFLSRVGW